MTPPPLEPAVGSVRRPLTDGERQLVVEYYNRTRKARVGVPVAGVVVGILYYALPPLMADLIFPTEVLTLMLFFLSIGFVIGGLSVTRKAAKVRRGIAQGQVVELSGYAVKLGQAIAARGGARQGIAWFQMQIGAERMLVRLSLYDMFQPQGFASLAYVEGADLAIAANRTSLLNPEEIKRPGLGGR